MSTDYDPDHNGEPSLPPDDGSLYHQQQLEQQEYEMTHCTYCGTSIDPARYALGYNSCLHCGEQQAQRVRHTIVPMPKSNYIVVTDHTLLQNLNSSHKGGR